MVLVAHPGYRASPLRRSCAFRFRDASSTSRPRGKENAKNHERNHCEQVGVRSGKKGIVCIRPRCEPLVRRAQTRPTRHNGITMPARAPPAI